MPLDREKRYVVEREDERPQQQENPDTRGESAYVAKELGTYVTEETKPAVVEETAPTAKEYLIENVEQPSRAELTLEERGENEQKFRAHATRPQDWFEIWQKWAEAKLTELWEEHGRRVKEKPSARRAEEKKGIKRKLK